MKKAAIYIGILAAVLLAVSLHSTLWQFKLERSVYLTERTIRDKQEKMLEYIAAELAAPKEECIESLIPDDMVIYKYRYDSLFSWSHEFPITNDDITAYSFYFRLQPNNSSDGHPLAYLNEGEWEYSNLGREWYLLYRKTADDSRTTLISGIRLALNLPEGLCHAPLMENPSGAVKGIDGTPVFCIAPDRTGRATKGNNVLKWIAMLLATVSLIMAHFSVRSARSLALASAGLAVIRILCSFISPASELGNSIFSPLVYAGSTAVPSLAAFLLNNALIASIVILIYSMRKKINRLMLTSGRRWIWAGSAWILTASLALYIRASLKSIISNSGITLDPSWIHTFTLYSVLCYISFAMLSLAFLFSLQTALRFTFPRRRIQLFSWKGIIICSAIISLYFVVSESVFGFRTEYESNRISTSKLAMRRNIRFELFLRKMENDIATDPFIGTLASVDGGSELIKNRLSERFLSKGQAAGYELMITICRHNDLITDGDGTASPCYQYFSDIEQLQGSRVEGSSNFSFIEAQSGECFYLGTFGYADSESRDVTRMFLEFKEKHRTRPPFVAALYSYAIYSGGKLTRSDGQFEYSMAIPKGYANGYSMVTKDGHVHFINIISDNLATVISRPFRPLLPYIVSFSYLLIFFAFFFYLSTIGHARGRFLSLPKHSVKRKITFITAGTMMVALASMGSASVAYNVRSRKFDERVQMDSRLSTVQSTLSSLCNYRNRNSVMSDNAFVTSVNELAAIINADINIYDVHGKLACTSRPDGPWSGNGSHRINSKAYHKIVHLNTVKTVESEVVGGKAVKSVYAPLTNRNGETIGIINIPYSGRTSTSEDEYPTVVMIANLYIVLLIAALIIGIILSNSMLRPLKALREKMENLTISPGRDKHIIYRNSKDEIGVLVKSYNEMVDALEESTRKLAQNERELAWKEMARQIAHDIKNPLTPMRLSIQHLIRMRQQNTPGWEDKVEKIGKSLIEQIDSLADTASQFSTIASSASDAPGNVNLDTLTREQIAIFDNNEHIRLVYDCKVEDPVILARGKQMARVIINLLTNAVQAVEGSNGSGNIRITINEGKVEGDKYYRLDFEDDGPGVSEENVGKLFSPNFTTKSSGTGLGLAICRSIVEQAGGTVSYSRSKLLGGACFTMMFPQR